MPSTGSAAPAQVPRPGLCQPARRGSEPPPSSWACCRSHSVANIITCAGQPSPPRAGKNTPADSKNMSPGSQTRQQPPPEWGSAAKSCLRAYSLEAFLSPAEHTCTELQACLGHVVLPPGPPAQLLRGIQGSYLPELETWGGDRAHPVRPAGNTCPGRGRPREDSHPVSFPPCRPTAGLAAQPLSRLHSGFKTKVNKPGS